MNEAASFWSKEQCPFDVASNQIDVWYINLNDSRLEHTEFLNADEKTRANKLLHPTNKQQFVRARASLRFILGHYLHSDPREIGFIYGEKGKPELHPLNSLKFNLSHSANTAVLAVTKNQNIGIDISHTDRNTNWRGIAKRSFTDSENALLEIAENKQATFHHLWSLKEAYTKALGSGFSYGFQNFSVDPKTGCVSDTLNPQADKDWSIVTIKPNGNTIAALAFKEHIETQLKFYLLASIN